MKTGIGLICQERLEQIQKHGFTREHDNDKYHQNGELVQAAKFCENCTGKDIEFDDGYPENWDDEWRVKFINKTKIQALIVSGALYLAENDRLHEGKYEEDIIRIALLIDEMQSKI